jgi:5-methylcytosine-specific restriction endonuclease McrA
LKRRLLAKGLLQRRCSECGLTDWRGAPLALVLDHINGDPRDHRLENLRLLCPNCNSQTPTFAGRNKRLRRLSATH